MEQIKLIDLVLSKRARKEIPYGMSDKERVVVGREYDNEIVIPEDYSDVSRTHCIIYQKEGKITIEDISTHGTYLNGERLTKGKEYLLNHGDKLKLAGRCKLEVRIGEEENLKLETEPEGSSAEFLIEDI